jgi:hypothetical protein
MAEAGPVLQAWRTGQSDRLAAQQRGALQEAGKLAATGSLGGARTHLLGQGMFDEANQIAAMMKQADDATLTKAKRTYEVLGNLALASDTPEKWQAALAAAAKSGMDVSKYQDFGARDMVLAQAGMVSDSITNQFKERELSKKEAPPQYEFTKAGVGNKYTGEFKPYAGGKGDPELTLEQGKYEQGLRKEYTALTSDLRAINDSLGRMQKSATINSGAGDIAMVYSYMKMLDPTSVVREGEYATAENTAGLPQKVVSMYNKIISGERLTPEQRQQFLHSGETLAKDKVQRFGKLRGQFETIAKESGADPNRIMLDEGSPVEAPAAPTAGQGQIDPRAVDMLRQDSSPEAMREFDEIFGPGAAQRVLGR